MHAKHVWAPACLLTVTALAMSAAPAGAAKKSQLKFFSSNVSTSVTDGTRPSTEGVSGPIHSAKRRSLGATGRDQDWQL
jgi:hypothetical protein